MKLCTVRMQTAILGSVLLLGAVSLTLFAVCHDREPVYQGKPLHEWMRNLNSAVETKDNRLIFQALRNAGDRALPVLLGMLRAEDTWMSRLMLRLQEHNLTRPNYLPPNEWNTRAVLAFMYLRQSASNAVPALIEMLGDTHSFAHQENAARALCFIGPKAKSAIPALLKAARSTNENVCRESIIALGDVRPPAELVVPVLVDAMLRHNTSVHDAASTILLCYGPDVAAAAKPRLVEVLRNGDQNARLTAARCLVWFDPDVALRAGMDTRIFRTGIADPEPEYKKLLRQY